MSNTNPPQTATGEPTPPAAPTPPPPPRPEVPAHLRGRKRGASRWGGCLPWAAIVGVLLLAFLIWKFPSFKAQAELGSAYAGMGSRVSLVEMTDGLLPGGADRDLVRVVAARAGIAYQNFSARDRQRQDAAQFCADHAFGDDRAAQPWVVAEKDCPAVAGGVHG